MEPGSIRADAVVDQSMKQLLKDNARFANEQPYSLQLEKALQRASPPAPLPDHFGARVVVIGDSGKGLRRLPAARLYPVILQMASATSHRQTGVMVECR